MWWALGSNITEHTRPGLQIPVAWFKSCFSLCFLIEGAELTCNSYNSTSKQLKRPLKRQTLKNYQDIFTPMEELHQIKIKIFWLFDLKLQWRDQRVSVWASAVFSGEKCPEAFMWNEPFPVDAVNKGTSGLIFIIFASAGYKEVLKCLSSPGEKLLTVGSKSQFAFPRADRNLRMLCHKCND